MFLIHCPYCGEREQSEFKAGGEAHIVRPKQPTELSDDQWAEYLFMRKISKVSSLKDGFMPMDVENGLTWLEIHLMMKLKQFIKWVKNLQQNINDKQFKS